MTLPLPTMEDATTPVSQNEFLRGVKKAVPMMIGFVPFGLVLGAQASAKGLSPAEVSLLTGINFAGGSEFAAIGLWTSPPHLLLLASVTLLINSRHILMGATLAPFLRRFPRSKALMALALMCDETWALTLADAREREKRGLFPSLTLPFYFGVAICLWLTWIASTAVGAMIGPALGDITRYGFDMAFPAVFLVLLRGMWTGVRAARPWLVSGVVAAAVYLLIPGAWYVPAGAVSGVLAAWFWSAEDKA